MVHAGATPFHAKALLLSQRFRRNNGQPHDRILMIEAVDAQCANILKEKLGRTLLAFRITWRLLKIENKKRGSQIATGSRNNSSLKSQ